MNVQTRPTMGLPWIEDGLIKALQARFPQKPIVPDHPLTQIMFDAGQQDVIRFLIEESKRQTAKAAAKT